MSVFFMRWRWRRAAAVSHGAPSPSAQLPLSLVLDNPADLCYPGNTAGLPLTTKLYPKRPHPAKHSATISIKQTSTSTIATRPVPDWIDSVERYEVREKRSGAECSRTE